MIARVVVENAAYSFDIPFSYQVPQQMQPDIRPGCRVLVPFGKANRAKQGLVLALEEGGEQENLKPLKTLLDYQPLLDSEQLWLLELLHRPDGEGAGDVLAGRKSKSAGIAAAAAGAAAEGAGLPAGKK